jgi:hypothetical protein
MIGDACAATHAPLPSTPASTHITSPNHYIHQNMHPVCCVAAQVEAYMGAARGVCIDLMRAIVSTGLLQFLGPQEQDPATFVTNFLADPVYMLKVCVGQQGAGWRSTCFASWLWARRVRKFHPRHHRCGCSTWSAS